MADLSLAAQAIKNAFDSKWAGTRHQALVAALRALADHRQAPIIDGQPIDHWHPDDRTRQELRNLAAELEGADA